MIDLTGRTLQKRYRIDGLIGRGGMAEVYKAWDTWRNYHVAIKVMREDLAEDLEFVRRFKREAAALSHLAHENVVRFYSFEQDDLLAYIVMDYVEGTTLRGEIVRAKGQLPWERVQHITGQVCSALHYAHMENVLHRDVKPGNIMIQPDGRVLVADFGIAKAADAATATTVMPGTPAYMSPEQCRSEPLDARTDIYSLGIVVYEMLAGRRPFVGDASQITTGSTREKIRWEQMNAPPPPLRQFNANLPPGVAGVVAKALAKNPAQRYASVLDFWQPFQQAAGVAETPITVQPAKPVTAAPIVPAAAEAGVKAEPIPVPAPKPPPIQEQPAAAPVSTEKPAGQPQSRSGLPPWAWAGVGVLVALLAILFLILTSDRTDEAVNSSMSADKVSALHSLEGHTGSVSSVVFSSDGTTLASGSIDGTARLWRVSDGRLLNTLEGHDDSVFSVVFSPDGATLASGSIDGTARLWRVSDGRLMNTLEGDAGWVSNVVFSPDGATLASGSIDGTARLWRVSDGRLLNTLEGHDDYLISVAFSPDGATLASGSDDRTVRLWRVSDGRLLYTLEAITTQY